MQAFWLIIKKYCQDALLGLKIVPKFKRSFIPQILGDFSSPQLYLFIAFLIILVFSGVFLIFSKINKQGPGPRYGGELTEGLVGQPQFINPILAITNGIDSDLSRIIYAQLLKYDQSGNLTPDLAASLPEVDKDLKTYSLKLKSGLKWQDGRPLTADDVIFTIQTIQNADFESSLRPNWARVKVAKVDDLTLTFQLREVSTSFINNFALGILPKHVWGEFSPQNFRLSDNNLKPVGSGPFQVSEIKKTSKGDIKSVTFKSNRNYHLGQPYISYLTFKFYSDYESLIAAYQGREIESLGYVPFDNRPLLINKDKLNQYKASLPQYQAVFFNLKNPVLSEKAVRQALWLTADRLKIINEVYNGEAAASFGPILPDSLGYNPQLEAVAHTSLSEAAAILDKAGWALDPSTSLRAKNKKPLEFNLAVSGSLVLNVKTAQILQSQWEQLGAKVNLTIVNNKELEDQYIRPRNFDALLFAENVGADPDPFPFWHSSQVHDPSLNFTGFSSAEADKLLTESRKTSDQNVKSKNYRRFQEIVNDQLPAIFLVRSLYIYNVPKKIQGISLDNLISPSDRFAQINRWYFED